MKEKQTMEDFMSFSRDADKPTKSDKFWNIAEKVSIVVLVGLAGSFVYTMVNSNYKTNGIPKDKFMQNVFRVPLTLPMTDRNIQVLIDENFSTEQKECIKEAVEELDVDLTGVTYTVELDNSKKQFQSVRINKVEKDDGKGLAVTKVSTTGFFGYINYPVKMEVQVDKIAPQKGLNEEETDYLKGIIKHEMLHTLGFVDIYDNSLKNKTIMYYATDAGKSYIHDLTAIDIDMVNKVYTLKNNNDEEVKYDVTVSSPKYSTVEMYKVQEDDDSFTF